MSPTPSVTLTDVTHCLYFMSVSLGLETGLFYMPSLTPFTVFHICFPRARGRSMLHALCDGHQQLLPQVPCGGQRRDAGFAWHWNRRSALPAALAHRRLRLAVRHVPLWLLHGSGWNRYVTVSVLVLVIHYHDWRCAYSVNVSVLVIHNHDWRCAYSVTVFLSWLTKF